ALRDAEEHGRGLKEGPRSSEYVTETTYRGRVLYLVDAVDLPESTDENGELLPGVSIEVSQVCWFDQGVTYIVGSPTLAPQELLVVARAIVDM
ncbi:MAG: hypothetical protein LLG24_04735, partial [Actinomycetia bacterium]|nr:hypothetical protein [Actinomycetes bacterium]